MQKLLEINIYYLIQMSKKNNMIKIIKLTEIIKVLITILENYQKYHYLIKMKKKF